MSADNFRSGAVFFKGHGRARGCRRAAKEMRRLLRILLPLAALAVIGPAPAAAQARTAVGAAHGFAPHQLVVKFDGQRRGRAVSLGRGAGVRQAVVALRQNPRVVYAEPDYIATASTSSGEPFDPNDPGALGDIEVGTLGNWAYKQWNFLSPEPFATAALPVSPGGIDAVGAWRNLIEAGRPGAAGVVVAVLDTGIAYRSYKRRFRRSPDFAAGQFAPGYDFVGHDRLPLDENGHGTHVAGTIAEQTNNGIGLTGLAYGAKLMPVRVLDRNGRGNAIQIAKGIRFAIANKAQVINMSFNFACRKKVPVVDEALKEAFEAGIVTVASAGNLGSEGCVSEPATGPRVLGVGGSTEGACLGDYSLAGSGIDLLAPGGGLPKSGCPSVAARPIYQVTLRPGSTRSFAIPATYVGTSMAAAHVSGAAALVLASEAIKHDRKGHGLVEMVQRRLRNTARDLGLPRTEQGAGLIDVGRATEPRRAS
ncbi:MAG TPA: S8 family serine peptidase [Solirubrobacterales bacterium]|nr:S8 family serine peptidase [Solirubrobacterales bacterium]